VATRKTKDPFAEFAVPAEKPVGAPAANQDPFAEFVAPATASAPETKKDEFSEYLAEKPADTTEAAPEREPYRPTEEFEGQHAELKSQNAITEKEIKEIAARYPDVDPKALASYAPYQGVRVLGPNYRKDSLEPLIQGAKMTAGQVGDAFFGIPQRIAKELKSQNTQYAIDDLNELIATRKPIGKVLSEVGTGLVFGAGAGKVIGGAMDAGKAAFGLGKVAAPAIAATEAGMPTGRTLATQFGKTVAHGVATGVGFGAASGAIHAKEGEALESAAKEGVVGGVVGGAFGVLVGALKAGGQIRQALGVRGEQEVTLLEETEKAMAAPEVAEQIRAGEERVSHIGVRGEAPAATIALERRNVTREVERLKADEEYMYKMADANPDLIQYMERNAGRQLSEDEMYTLLAKEVSRNKAEGELVEFARYLDNPTGKLPSTMEELTEVTRPTNLRKAGDRIREWTSQGRDETFLRQEYRNFKAVQTATDLNLDKVAREAGVTSSELTRKVRTYFRVRGQFKIIDNRSGTALEPLADSFVQADNLKNLALNRTISEAMPVLDASSKTGLRTLSVAQIEALERTGDVSKLSEEQRPVMQAFSELFEGARKKVAKLGVTIQEISTEKAKIYVPRMQVDAVTTTGRVRDRIRQVEEASGISFKSHFQDEDIVKMREKGGTAFSELLQAHEFMTGEQIKTAAQLSKFVAEARTVDGSARMIAAKSSRQALSLAKARAEVGIPSFLRETDLNKLYIRWNADALKQAYWRNSLQDLTKQRGLLAASGDRAGVEYVDAYLKEIAGGKRGLARWAIQTKNELGANLTARMQAAERAGDKKSAILLSTLQSGLELPGILTGVMYGNIFALNPKALVQNLMQPLVTTLPELSLGGNGWAMAKGLKGYFETLKALRNPFQLSKILEERGYIAPHFSDEMSGAFRTGVEKGAASRMSLAVLDKMTQYGMFLMQTSETINRVATMKMAESVAEDLMRGSQSAKYFLNGVGSGYRYQFKKLVQAGDLPALQTKMADYLVAKTMFHYSPLMASQLGNYLGRIGTAFSTWPTTITADAVGDFANKNQMAGRYLLVKKYMAPLAGLLALDHIAKGLHVGPDESPRTKALIGQQGFSGGAPIRSMTDIATRGVFSSPYVEEAFKGFAAAASGDADGWWKATKGMGSLIIPGAGYLHAAQVTAPRLFLNQEPEK